MPWVFSSPVALMLWCSPALIHGTDALGALHEVNKVLWLTASPGLLIECFFSEHY